MSEYKQRISSRSKFRFYLGALARLSPYIRYGFYRWLARKKGALIGQNSVINYQLAKNANENLIIGNNCSIQTDKIDLRAKVIIGNNVIIGQNVEIIVASHNINSPEWELKLYGINIEDYVWLATNSFVLPSCRVIKYGAVCGAGSIVNKNVDAMSVVSGNPAKEIKKRETIHSDLVVPSLLGGDLKSYIETYKYYGKKN
ncbi:acyltransferase [Elizabethkingia anophelis]|uniref:acyltransferase n=1 Tax=Elizabethkingia anophelis TaxID=1117645 RepID=UPI00201172B0|nr:acyltransferase [Elizabethkingia anophelis]EJC8061660.1 acyltransferase [Elizabethkingia anophelis]MCL1642583.1 acyltransferase [Elizabethkingia anophelis]MCL1645832.1 acyltransferase [Elizabethkingia anophelis]MCT4034785.1 acyltransferase [Elizabethkingia anophelis]MCT4035136.1 acyltransferase [Elizabethkingia anophelis]